jgi:hypothetical protein
MKPSGFSAESLAEVFRCRRSELVRLGAFILGDRSAAEDVVQDVFLRVHQRGDRLADLDDPLPYLRGAVVNGCRSVLRRRRLIRRHAGKDQPCPPLSAEEAMLLSEDRRQVLAALARQTQAREGMADPAGRRSLRRRGHRCLGTAYREPRPHLLARQPAGAPEVPGVPGLPAASGGRTGNGPATVLRDH